MKFPNDDDSLSRNMLENRNSMVNRNSKKIIFAILITAVLVISVTSISFADHLSLLQQIQNEVPTEDLQCKENHVLVLKNDGNPACVDKDDVFRLLQTGWATKIIPQKNSQPHIENMADTWYSQHSAVPEESTSAPASAPAPPTALQAESSYVSDAEPAAMRQVPDIAYESSSESIGFAVGGAQDINNFRENIENNFLPLHTDITHEGLFYDYFFDTGKSQECKKLFCPSYSYAISEDPFSKNDDYYLSVGLNSGIKESDFQRKKLNLVIVLDVSGSMSSQFNTYHYDNSRSFPNLDDKKSKMQLANESVVGLLDHLTDDDNFGVVLFDNHAQVAKPLENMGFTDKERLAENILQIYPVGGTNMESGMILGTSLFDEFEDINSDEYENRIIFLTDAMPNLGNTSDSGLLGMITNNAKERIYTTFIGIGVDFNTELAEKLTKAKGSNYYSVHSASEFKNRMVDEFEFMVTPLVFNLLLSLDAEGYDIKKVYGSPEADESTGQIMKVNTLFPSKTKGGEIKGGIVLLKLEKTSEDAKLVLKTSYEDRNGQLDGDQVVIRIDDQESNHYDNSGIQKGVLLSRYAELMKTWVFDERRSLYDDRAIIEPSFFYDQGLHVPQYVETKSLGQWERMSSPLQVSDEYEKLFMEFNEYFYREMKSIGDDSLEQEIKILNKLENY